MNTLNREIICLRTVDSDETGLLLSIPFPVFYKYSNPETNIVSMEIECFNSEEAAAGFVHFGLLDKQFLLLDSSGECLGYEKDFTIITNTKKNQQKISFNLFVKADISSQQLKIYDGYYYLYTSIDSKVFDSQSYYFCPCFLNAVYGCSMEKHGETCENTEKRRTSLLIDDYTKRIQGVVSDYDCLFSEHNQTVINNDDFIPVKHKIHNMTGLINKYSCADGNIVQTDYNDPGIKTLAEIRRKMERLRYLQSRISKSAVHHMIFHEFKKIRYVQKLVRKCSREISGIRKEILEMQVHIQNQKHALYKEKCSRFISTNNFKYYASVCLLIKDENDYLEEWLKHYESIGIQHFYIYDNKSKISIEQTIHMIDHGHFDDMCTVIPFTDYKKNMQYECYENCLSNYGRESRWIGFFDTDEFVDIKEDSVNDFLKKYEKYFCVWIPWEIYNANGRLNKRHASMKSLFNRPFTDPFGLWGKVFIQPHRTKYMYVHLAMGMDENERAVNTDYKDHLLSYQEVFNESRNGGIHLYSDAKIRHYMTRSFDEWCEKMKRGSSDPNFKRKFDVFFDYNPDMKYLEHEPYVKKLTGSTQGYS